MGLLTEILDYGLLTVNLYVLLRIRISKEEAFKTPFFYWFFMAGMASSLSVVGFIIGSRFIYPAEEVWKFKLGYMLNSFSVTFSVIEKIFIAFHRYSVMRTNTFSENIWSRKITIILTAITALIAFGGCSPVFWCGIIYKKVGSFTVVGYLDDACIVTQKTRASVQYFLYIVFSIIMTVLTSRLFIKLLKHANDSTKALIVSNQRNLFIIVSICTISQIIKATHQFCWVFVAVFEAAELNVFLQNTYDVTHYFATYSCTVSLVIFNKKVRRLMVSTNIREPQRSSFVTATTVIVFSMTIMTDVLDYGLLTANLYVLLRIRISKEEAFKTPFFYWFFMAGMASSLSVVGFIIGSRFIYPAEEVWKFKLGYVSFGIFFDVKLVLRHVVMRTTTFTENIWSRKITVILSAITALIAFGGCSPVFWCGIIFKKAENITVVGYLDDACIVTQKTRASVQYFLYVVFSVAMTVLTSRQFIKLSKHADDSTKALIISNQRNMFIIVSICTITQMIKATHQFCWVFVAVFKAADLNVFLQNTYDVTHYITTYSCTVSLVIFNKKVRQLIISTNIREPQKPSVVTCTTVVSKN